MKSFNKNILHVLPSLNTGGLQKVVIDLANSVSELGSKVVIFSINPKNSDSFHSLLQKNIVLYTGSTFRILSIFKIAWLVYKYNIKVIHAHGIGLVFCFFPALLRYKTVYTVHNLVKQEAGTFRLYINWFYFKYLSVIPVCVSNAVRDSFISFYNIECNVIYNSVIIRPKSSGLSKLKSSLNLNENDRLVLNVGRIDSQKNQIILAKALSLLNQRIDTNIKYTLLIVGSITDNNLYNSIVNVGNVRVIHHLPTNEIFDYYHIADIFALSSTFEGMPISLIEALSEGLNCLVTPVGGIIDLKDSPIFICDSVTTESIYNEFINYELRPYSSSRILLYFEQMFKFETFLFKYIDVYNSKRK